ncbi:MAG: heme exporter protein CcmB [Acidimicrobiia bacterium]|nr:heme exporter protein CcmB [Acidimicrobiia bacterium]
MLRDTWLMAVKDLRIELGSRVVTAQILPFGLLVLILFGLAISPDLLVTGDARRSVLEEIAPGLFWLAVLLSALMALARAFALEADDGNLDALRMAGIDPAGVFLGKALAVAVQLVAIEAVLGFGAVVVFGVPLSDPLLLAVTLVLATFSITLAGTLYAALASGLRSRDTLVPLLVLPVLAPVLLGATLATRDALFADPAVPGWSWAMLLAVFSLLYLGVGMLAFGPLLEET